MKFPRNEREEVEGQVMKIYKESSPALETLFEWAYINHVAWSLAIVFLGLIFWLSVALVNAENQRNALITKQCMDPVFKTELDKKCLRTVQSREHWWQHLTYALTNLSPAK
ncbi:hypothetical protein SAMN05216319_3696 [Duganella sp. CF402]|uniref:hypothetical protein n=1 Tax=unclassified Duganella TaxID=2636909 RepID=UPI0008C0C01A|nr:MULTISPECIES: hypothetical protein [unclassified Duganella]RZT04519.1 hypothetical protein EV582_5409 [Duganella sp. BK701]SEM33546.1 hypothetical protein SAMN05216319_3696 [Duganella sp. CF402]